MMFLEPISDAAGLQTPFPQVAILYLDCRRFVDFIQKRLYPGRWRAVVFHRLADFAGSVSMNQRVTRRTEELNILALWHSCRARRAAKYAGRFYGNDKDTFEGAVAPREGGIEYFILMLKRIHA